MDFNDVDCEFYNTILKYQVHLDHVNNTSLKYNFDFTSIKKDTIIATKNNIVYKFKFFLIGNLLVYNDNNKNIYKWTHILHHQEYLRHIMKYNFDEIIGTNDPIFKLFSSNSILFDEKYKETIPCLIGITNPRFNVIKGISCLSGMQPSASSIDIECKSETYFLVDTKINDHFNYDEFIDQLKSL